MTSPRTSEKIRTGCPLLMSGRIPAHCSGERLCQWTQSPSAFIWLLLPRYRLDRGCQPPLLLVKGPRLLQHHAGGVTLQEAPSILQSDTKLGAAESWWLSLLQFGDKLCLVALDKDAILICEAPARLQLAINERQFYTT